MSKLPIDLIPEQTINNITGGGRDGVFTSISVQVTGASLNGSEHTRTVTIQQSNDNENWGTIQDLDAITIINGTVFVVITDFYSKYIRAVVAKGTATQGTVKVIIFSR